MKAKPSLDLRSRIIDAAGKLFAEHGYQSVSMRRVADLAGCSQMAMYRHFKDKEALILYLCAGAYERFATRVNRTIEGLSDPRDRIFQIVKATIRFAVSHPQHYRISMMMMMPQPELETPSPRERLAQVQLQRLQDDIRALLPPNTTDALVQQRLHQILACMNGMNMMLLAHPHTYGLTRERAITEAQTAVLILLNQVPHVDAAP